MGWRWCWSCGGWVGGVVGSKEVSFEEIRVSSWGVFRF